MAEKITSINNQMLAWARIESNTPLDTAETKFKNIKKWESGEDYPTYAQLRSLSDYYRKPLAVFFFPEAPKIENIQSSFRTLPENAHSIINRDVAKIIDWARVMQLNLYELNDNINPSVSKITDFNFNTANISDTAKQLRELLGSTLSEQKRIDKLSDAFEYWRDCFYRIGVFVFKEAFKDRTVSGFCIYDSEFPVICINNSLSASRQIFTLFHEIYHIIHQTGGVDLLDDSILDFQPYDGSEIERNCNRFAAEFLVPDDDFTNAIKKITVLSDYEIEKLAKMYSVSREVVMRKFLNHGVITSAQYEEKREEYNKEYFRFTGEEQKKGKGGGNYYSTQLTYKGKRYAELAFNGYYAQKFSITQLAQYMGMKISSVQSLASQKGWGAL